MCATFKFHSFLKNCCYVFKFGSNTSFFINAQKIRKCFIHPFSTVSFVFLVFLPDCETLTLNNDNRQICKRTHNSDIIEKKKHMNSNQTVLTAAALSEKVAQILLEIFGLFTLVKNIGSESFGSKEVRFYHTSLCNVNMSSKNK